MLQFYRSFNNRTQIGKQPVSQLPWGHIILLMQKIKEEKKGLFQFFEGVVIRTDRKNSLTSRITVRKVTSGVGVEKSFLLHNPLVEKVEIVRRSKVRRNYLSYLRNRSGKSARLKGVDFDREKVNDVKDPHAEAEEARLKEEAKKAAAEKQSAKESEEAELKKKQEEVEARHKED